MRLWHKDLIDVLPRQQLLSQWRECCAIASRIATEGTPNHMLVNKVTEYSSLHFIEYTNKILKEMSKRSYKVSEVSYLRFVENMRSAQEHFYEGIMINKDVYPGWMDNRYFRQCYFNLEEKYDCGGISENEWKPIHDLYKQKLEEKRKELKEMIEERRQKNE